jgi:hypothetical protein
MPKTELAKGTAVVFPDNFLETPIELIFIKLIDTQISHHTQTIYLRRWFNQASNTQGPKYIVMKLIETQVIILLA